MVSQIPRLVSPDIIIGVVTSLMTNAEVIGKWSGESDPIKLCHFITKCSLARDSCIASRERASVFPIGYMYKQLRYFPGILPRS